MQQIYFSMNGSKRFGNGKDIDHGRTNFVLSLLSQSGHRDVRLSSLLPKASSSSFRRAACMHHQGQRHQQMEIELGETLRSESGDSD